MKRSKDLQLVQDIFVNVPQSEKKFFFFEVCSSLYILISLKERSLFQLFIPRCPNNQILQIVVDFFQLLSIKYQTTLKNL